MDKNQQKKNTIKIILLGNQNVGKTSLISIYSGKKFSEDTISTIGSDFIYEKINIDNTEYTIQLWDTAGQEQFRSLNKIYFKGSDIVLFIYDITKKKTFDDLPGFWINYVKSLIGENIIYGIVANKVDLFENKEVEEESGQKLANENHASFCQTSAKETPEVFKKFIKDLVVLHISKNGAKEGNAIKLEDQKSKKDKDGEKGCCLNF